MPPQMMTYRFFAKSYNWTPDQVDALSLDCLEWLPLIEVAAESAAEFVQQREARMAQAKQR